MGWKIWIQHVQQWYQGLCFWCFCCGAFLKWGYPKSSKSWRTMTWYWNPWWLGDPPFEAPPHVEFVLQALAFCSQVSARIDEVRRERRSAILGLTGLILCAILAADVALAVGRVWLKMLDDLKSQKSMGTFGEKLYWVRTLQGFHWIHWLL